MVDTRPPASDPSPARGPGGGGTHAQPRRPLAGVRVLDLTRALAGPFSTMILGDLGATVIKVEPSDGGDMTRTWGPFAAEQSIYYLSANRSKRSVALDFRHPDGIAVVKRLARGSHVVMENFRPGVADAMGLGYEALRLENPALIYASISGFGSTGPAKDWPGFDQIAQGHAGLMSLTGSGEPTRVGVPIGDMTAGMWAALAVVAALRNTEATGRGERIETSLVASLVSLLGIQGQRFLSLGEVPVPTGNSHPVIAPYGTFAAADGPLNVAPATDRMWRALCVEIGVPDLATDPRFASNEQRVAHRTLLNSIIEERIRMRPRREWLTRLLAVGIPVGLINDLGQVFADDQVRHCAMVRTVEHPAIGPIPQLALPIRLDSTDVQTPLGAPPLLGQDTTGVLRESGFSDTEIESLIARGVVAQAGA